LAAFPSIFQAKSFVLSQAAVSSTPSIQKAAQSISKKNFKEKNAS
jgi:hypothetical protein